LTIIAETFLQFLLENSDKFPSLENIVFPRQNLLTNQQGELVKLS